MWTTVREDEFSRLEYDGDELNCLMGTQWRWVTTVDIPEVMGVPLPTVALFRGDVEVAVASALASAGLFIPPDGFVDSVRNWYFDHTGKIPDGITASELMAGTPD